MATAPATPHINANRQCLNCSVIFAIGINHSARHNTAQSEGPAQNAPPAPLVQPLLMLAPRPALPHRSGGMPPTRGPPSCDYGTK